MNRYCVCAVDWYRLGNGKTIITAKTSIRERHNNHSKTSGASGRSVATDTSYTVVFLCEISEIPPVVVWNDVPQNPNAGVYMLLDSFSSTVLADQFRLFFPFL